MSSTRSYNEPICLSGIDKRWVPTFIKSGASAFVGTYWTTAYHTTRLFWRHFYHSIWHKQTLGNALQKAQLAVAKSYPESLDWLAFFLVGNPMARGYVPDASTAYVTVECPHHDLSKPLKLNKTYSMIATLRTKPPDWDIHRRKQIVKESWLESWIYVFASNFQVDPGNKIHFNITETNLKTAAFTITPQQSGDCEMFVHFLSGQSDTKHTISFTLQVEP